MSLKFSLEMVARSRSWPYKGGCRSMSLECHSHSCRKWPMGGAIENIKKKET